MIPQSATLTCCYSRNRINVRLLFGQPNSVRRSGEITTYWFAPGQCFGVLWWARLSPRRQVAGFAVAEAIDAGQRGFQLPFIDGSVRVHAYLNCRCAGKDRGVVGRAGDLIQRIQQADIDPRVVPPAYYRFASQALRVGHAPRVIDREQLFYFLEDQPMRTDRIIRAVIHVAGTLTVLLIFRPPPRGPLVLYNRTPSMPIGWYVCCDHALQRGDVVAFALPRAAWEYAHQRGDSTHLLLLKHVLAMRGDFVSTLHHQLRVNGVLLGNIASADSAGRALPKWKANHVLIGDELLVGSLHRHSFDSRYFGPIHVDQVVGVYRRLTVSFSFFRPTENDSLRDSLSPPERSRTGPPSPPIFDRVPGDGPHAELNCLKDKCRNCLGHL